MPTRSELLDLTGEFYHIYDRGVNRDEIFGGPGDYAFFLDLIRKYLEEYPLTIHAYVLMPNHFHMAVRQDERRAMSGFMKSLLEHYGRKLTAGGTWVGHVFQGRYRLKHVNRPEYLLQLSRYIHLNPVEARLAASPDQWPYSSCRSYLGIADGSFVSTGTVLSLAGGQERYREYLSRPSPTLDDEMRKILMTSDVDV